LNSEIKAINDANEQLELVKEQDANEQPELAKEQPLDP